MNHHKRLTRRTFLQNSGAALGAALVIPSTALGKDGSTAPSERVSMGFIGMGTMGNGHLFGEAWTYLPGGYLARKDVIVPAVCDVWRKKRESSRDRVNQFYTKQANGGSYKACEAYRDFRDLLARDDIDAALIATPIHWHATMTVYAANAGKDVYCEKPTAVTIRESQAAVKAIQKNNRIFQAGTQQRSEYDGKFHRTCELIRNGCLGKMKSIYAYREGGGAIWPETFENTVPVPEDFDWDLWLGPAPMLPYQGNPHAHLFGFGGINWGQHHYDIVQWSLGADRTGPVVIGIDDDGKAVYRYADGTVVYGRPYKEEKIGETGGGWYFGTEGRIAVDREHLISDPPSILETELGQDAKRLYKTESHSGNFLECVKTRRRTICDIETAHRAASLLLLGGIAQRVKRPLQWDPKEECFLNDEEANRLLTIPKRTQWEI